MTRYGRSLVLLLLVVMIPLGARTPAHARERWDAQRANQWYDGQVPWLVGCNYAPAYSVNQIEMWQADTFDLAAIDEELGWAQDLGFTSVRVFLHHLLWEQDSDGLLKRMEQFLEVAERRRIGVMFVLFDSVWDPNPKLGRQPPPRRGLHNSGWVQSPGRKDLEDAGRRDLLKRYVTGVIGRFKDDKRVQVWDVYNEPDNDNRNSYGEAGNKQELDARTKVEKTLVLLRESFEWARAAEPSQPITSGVWIGEWSTHEQMSPTAQLQVSESDVISFHNYDGIAELKRRVGFLRRYGRPLLCTEFMARPRGSTFEEILPYFREPKQSDDQAAPDQRIAAYCWGFVAGKSNTIYPWDSWQGPYDVEPRVWFHDIFRRDGAPFDPRELQAIRRQTKR